MSRNSYCYWYLTVLIFLKPEKRPAIRQVVAVKRRCGIFMGIGKGIISSEMAGKGQKDTLRLLEAVFGNFKKNYKKRQGSK